MMAAAIIYVLPPIALLFAFRRYIAASLTMVSSGAQRDSLARSRAVASHTTSSGANQHTSASLPVSTWSVVCPIPKRS